MKPLKMKQLLLDTLALGKSVVLLREKRELYLLLGAAAVAGHVAGLLVGFETKALQELFTEDGDLTHKMLRLLGEYGTSLAQAR